MKRTYILIVTIVFCTMGLYAQSKTILTDVKVGDVLEIGKPETSTYKHINLPRPNMILKRGGRVNYDAIVGAKVIVTAIKVKKDGTIIIKIKQKDKKRFFGSHGVLTATYKDALQTGELIEKRDL